MGMKAPRTQAREFTAVLYDPTDPASPVLHVRPDSRTEESVAAKQFLAMDAKREKANEQKRIDLSTGLWDRGEERLDAFVVGWSGLTPTWFQRWLTAGRASLSDRQVERMEADLKEAGESEYMFDAVTYKDFLEDGPLFRMRIKALRNDVEALAAAEEAYRHFFSPGTSDGRTSEAA